MPRPDLPPGTVVPYPYLWKWQRDRGETEGRKSRPVCVVIATTSSQSGLTHLALLAISSRPPIDNQTALEIPEIECRRGGLSDLKSGWITLSEYNYDVAEKSFYFDPNHQALGRFSKSFMRRLAALALPLFSRGGARVDRADG